MTLWLYLEPSDAHLAWYRGLRYTDTYAQEILAHAGLPFQTLERAALRDAPLKPDDLIVFGRHARFEPEAKDRLKAFVASGGTLIGMGGAAGLEELFAVTDMQARAEEAYLTAVAGHHPLNNLLQVTTLARPLHTYGSPLYQAHGATVLAHLDVPDTRSSVGQATERSSESRPIVGVSIHSYEQGQAILIAPDILGSVITIQQGGPVYVDGPPAPDGTVPLDDDTLKADDGIRLDYTRDRSLVAGEPMFATAIADRLRELLLQTIYWHAAQRKQPLAQLWYWPGALDAVGHISHDTDANDPALGRRLFEEMQKAKIRSTWCVIYPGGYAPAFYRELIKEGYEIALHYDALAGKGRTVWSLENLIRQRDWLLDMSGLDRLVSNKNHYTRWEGETEFFRWLEEAGIATDQTRGPSKRGNVGFLFGSCHPWFPVDDNAHHNRFIDVLELPLHAQDLIITCPYEFGPAIVDEAVARHGVAHLLFHPAHIAKPGIADALQRIVAYGKERGLAWWTSAEINAWERLRREVRIEPETGPNVGWAITHPRGSKKTGELTLLVGPVDEDVSEVRVNGSHLPARTFKYCGFTFARVTLVAH